MSVRLDHGEDSLAEMHEINVTPFIDVMLVLLIIFMVAAPLATVDIAVNLPASAAEPQPRPRQAAVPHRQSRPDARARRATGGRARRSVPRSTQRPTATRTRASSCAPTRRSPMAS